MNKIKISDGVNLTSISTNKFSTECLSLTFLRPINTIDPSFMAILPHILLSGSKNYPSIELISKKLDYLYGAKIEPIIRKKGEFLCMSFVCDVIDSKFVNNENLLKEIFDILTDIIYNPLVECEKFDKNIVENEKNNLINRINSVKNDKRSYANTRMFEIMCKNEPFGLSRFGTIESAKNIDECNLFKQYNNIINNSQVEIFYCGSSDISSLDLQKIPARKSLVSKLQSVSYSPNTTEIVETMNISQGKLSIGFRTNILANDPLYPALAMFNTIFGGSTTSKLFENVREAMSLCYYASSNIEKIKGVMSVNSGIEVHNFEIAKEAILKQFFDIQQGNFSQQEINSAKLTLLNNLNSAKDSKYALEDFYLGQAICCLDDEIDELISAIDSVSKQQIIDAALMVTIDTIFFLKGDLKND
ncbi:MAG: pitrilysin family protein [Clostridia bacterium]